LNVVGIERVLSARKNLVGAIDEKAVYRRRDRSAASPCPDTFSTWSSHDFTLLRTTWKLNCDAWRDMVWHGLTALTARLQSGSLTARKRRDEASANGTSVIGNPGRDVGRGTDARFGDVGSFRGVAFESVAIRHRAARAVDTCGPENRRGA
jgi:hypothetical protein